MIKRNKFGDFSVYCDHCSDFFDTTEDSIGEAWYDAKLAGWGNGRDTAYPYGGHLCPDCLKKVQDEDR